MAAATETLSTEKLPLTEEERNLLASIYQTRSRFFVSAIAGLLLLAGIASIRGSNRQYNMYHDHTHGSGGDYVPSSFQTLIMGIVILGGPISIFAVVVYRKRIGCFKKDLRDGYKYAAYKLIVEREYFPITDQYFVRLDDPKYMHHEIDQAIYNQVHEGEQFPVYFAPYSKYAFNPNGTFSIL